MGQQEQEREVLIEEWDKPEPYFEIPERLTKSYPGKYRPWRVVPDDKKQPAHRLASTQDTLVAVHPNAIAIGASGGTSDRTFWGWFLIGLGLLMNCMSVFALLIASSEFYRKLNSDYLYKDWYLDVSMMLLSLILLIVGGLFVVFIYRGTFKTPSDWPILFNRKIRQVTYFVPLLPHFFKFWKPTPMEMHTESWDEAKVRSYRWRGSTGRSFHDLYGIWLLWGGEGGNPRLLRNMVNIGYLGYWQDERLFQVWEHIRRYMEEDGAPIQLGDKLRKPITNQKPWAFPAEVIEAAGGPALSSEAVAKLAQPMPSSV